MPISGITVGSSAEWIVERTPQYVNGVLTIPDLANYGNLEIPGVKAMTTTSSDQTPNDNNCLKVTMVNGPDTLSTTDSVVNGDIKTSWHQFH